MRIIARRSLREFWEKHSEVWYSLVKKSSWKNFNDLKANIRHASVVGNDRVVFNVKGNDYRLIAAIDYEKQILWIRFVGTHSEYDKIEAKNI